ncbi:MAG: TauD/TfdA family dioxygenase [Alphaproteobacteria bacterium]|nr:TauD/TfdA family dioxygenase [Alphaproteobacteria bacterium]
MAGSPRWRRALDPAQVAALERALADAQRRGENWKSLTARTFPLPELAPLVADIRDELENGSGILKLSGVPVAGKSLDALRLLYFGLGRHVGTPVFQNRRGELMRAIRDEGGDLGARYGQVKTGEGGTFLSSYARTLSNGRLRFHTDRTDVVSLLCVRQARAGGVSKLCSSAAVHNAMQARRPDLATLLRAPIWRSRLGEESDRAEDVYPLPIFGQRDGRFTSHYSLTYIEAAQLVEGVPKLTSAQREAIEMLMTLAEELCFEMTLEPGDLQFINSHVTYHGRTEFEDDAASGRDRLLLRLWLSMPNSRALPEDHAVLWRDVAAGARRGGIAQTG